MIAICDHNSAANVASVTHAARGTGVTVLPGIEVQTAEEIHVLGLFDDLDAAADVARQVRQTLPAADAEYYRHFGDQDLLDSDGRIVGSEPRMLDTSTALSLADAVDLIHSRGGLAIAAHVNRPSFSVFSQLGLFPEAVGFDAIELFAPSVAAGRWKAQIDAARLPAVFSSDAHRLNEISPHTLLTLDSPTFGEFRLALRGEGGRSVSRA